MQDDDLIVSKTNLKGRIAYANDVFLDIAGYRIGEVLDQPHSMIRSEAMPRAVFKLLWDRIQAGREVFAYVVNKTKPGGHYWVLAHVTPSRDKTGQIIGYHSNRRKPSPQAVARISKFYAALLREEKSHKNGKQALAASYALLEQKLAELGVDYDEFVLSV